MRPLNYRQRLFVEHYLGESSGSAVDAARRAGYRWPETLGPRLVKKSGVRAAIDARVETAAIAANKVLARIADVATSDLLNFIEVDSNGDWKVDLKLVKRRSSLNRCFLARCRVIDVKGSWKRHPRESCFICPELALPYLRVMLSLERQVEDDMSKHHAIYSRVSSALTNDPQSRLQPPAPLMVAL